ncbi:C40 family peptidase [Galliscardovia ingluviei]|nr:C40 family peptidase [Galliscardovia ingluviei]
MKIKKPKTIVVTMLAALTLTAGIVPAATAVQDAPVVSASRSFKGVQSRDAKLLDEAVSVKVDANYGGIESLSVPQTKSQAEKDAEAQAQRALEAAQAAQAAQQAAQAASRSAARQAASAAVELPASASGSAVVSTAMQYLGAPYVFGGTTPAGWDCSGFTSYVFRQFGLEIGRTDAAQRAYGQSHGVRVSNPQPGDLMWMPGHVGIYIGGGKMIHAATPSSGTLIESTSWASFEYYRLIQ